MFAPTLLPRVPTHRLVLNIPCAFICPPTCVYHQKCVCHLPTPHNYPATSVFAPTHARLPSQACLLPRHKRIRTNTAAFTLPSVFASRRASVPHHMRIYLRHARVPKIRKLITQEIEYNFHQKKRFQSKSLICKGWH